MSDTPIDMEHARHVLGDVVDKLSEDAIRRLLEQSERPARRNLHRAQAHRTDQSK